MYSIYVAMSIFSLTMSISPGPVNMISLSIGVNKGFRASLPFALGAALGFSFLLLAVAFGFETIFDQAPRLMDILTVIGVGFMMIIGHQIAQSSVAVSDSVVRAPSFFSGLLLQWLNPKAWVASVTGVAAFSVTQNYLMLIRFVSIYFIICFLAIASWAFFGEKLGRALASSVRLRSMNLIMGYGLMLVCGVLLIEKLAKFLA